MCANMYSKYSEGVSEQIMYSLHITLKNVVQGVLTRGSLSTAEYKVTLPCILSLLLYITDVAI